MTKDEALTADAYEVCRAVMLKILRATGRCTAGDCAKVLGVSRQQVSRMLARERGMGLKPRLAACEYLEAGT